MARLFENNLRTVKVYALLGADGGCGLIFTARVGKRAPMQVF